MADLSDVERMVDDWERDAVAKSQRYAEMQAQVEQISITGSVAGGAVSVTVGPNGLPTDVAMTDAVLGMRPEEIAANVLKAMRKAQSQYPEKMREIVADTVGDDDASRHIVATAEENFPPAPEEDEEPAAEAPGRQLKIETEDDEEPPAPKPPRRPAPGRRRDGGDDGDFGEDQTFLRRD
ncbi:YbaB/EbfC family nucleoid-associated protein [Amycolatopsis sp. CA-230715]|uniref:YbaB/EbfC family nucleoid-associated protein n=1 Tax=Amycolatopsis sp. CA-230715 TaxID=2745196 RepID=UPI001C00FF5D|nr:YbaB/EbfC family nucleoid-associated protein [Amycolatopsis sp. CA-230715]QWF84749.1 Nucleoid-associated protein YbaB [Amycolatopsis sp. CA-230715]